ADQDHRGQGQGGQAGDREADHARAQGRPARAPPGDVDPPASRQGRDLQALRGDRSPLHGASGRLHADPQAGPAFERRHGNGLPRAGLSTKLTLEYDGGPFAGWAVQPGQRSVAAEVVNALQTVLREPVDLAVSYPGPLPNLRGVNALLPREIVALRAETVPDGFSARHDARTRTYRY